MCFFSFFSVCTAYSLQHSKKFAAKSATQTPYTFSRYHPSRLLQRLKELSISSSWLVHVLQPNSLNLFRLARIAVRCCNCTIELKIHCYKNTKMRTLRACTTTTAFAHAQVSKARLARMLSTRPHPIIFAHSTLAKKKLCSPLDTLARRRRYQLARNVLPLLA